ncbi:MAG: hemolysin family protein [Lachnospiraceae bacterium]
MEEIGPTISTIIIVLLAIDIGIYIFEIIMRYLANKNLQKADAEEEIISMVNESHEQGFIQKSEVQMITNIFELGEKDARDIMTHRSNIVAIDSKSTLNEAVSFILKEGNSRFPVYEENLDHIVGVLHLKDAFRMQSNNVYNEMELSEIPNLLRKASFIPETRGIDDLFRSMQSSKNQMVIVKDEYGQTSGLVAMEDILEEIVGNILDEYDSVEEHIEEKGEDQYVIEGITPLEELENRFDISFEEEDFETLNGFLISKMEKIPEQNEEFEIQVGTYIFKVLEVENKMIHSVLVTKIKE